MLADPINPLLGRRLVITGGSGFIGARPCRRAVEEGAIVHALSRRPQELELVLPMLRANLVVAVNIMVVLRRGGLLARGPRRLHEGARHRVSRRRS
jgi:NAD(P)-dependent dehydrogenase (short-subunit alcohol dehydrogenase family)